MIDVSNIKLLAFDMDGTALDDAGRVTERTRRALQAVADMGIMLVPATGTGTRVRPWESISQTVFRYANNYPMTIDAISSGKFDVKSMVTDIYDYEETQRAFEESLSRKAEIIKGVVSYVKPRCVIAIDALASRRLARLANTVQLS